MTTATHSPKEQFLHQYDAEHAITMRVLKAFPPDKMDLKPHPRCPTAKALAWIFVMERGLAGRVFDNVFAAGMPSTKLPGPPDTWNELLDALEKAHLEFRQRVVATPDDDLNGKVKFFTAPKTLGDVGRLEFAWFLLHDQIHHRGQFSIYLRMADGKVPTIYGPSGDEPWN